MKEEGRPNETKAGNDFVQKSYRTHHTPVVFSADGGVSADSINALVHSVAEDVRRESEKTIDLIEENAIKSLAERKIVTASLGALAEIGATLHKDNRATLESLRSFRMAISVEIELIQKSINTLKSLPTTEMTQKLEQLLKILDDPRISQIVKVLHE